MNTFTPNKKRWSDPMFCDHCGRVIDEHNEGGKCMTASNIRVDKHPRGCYVATCMVGVSGSRAWGNTRDKAARRLYELVHIENGYNWPKVTASSEEE